MVITTKLGSFLGDWKLEDGARNGEKMGSNGQLRWVSIDPTPEEVAELVHRFPEVVVLPEEEVMKETDDWLAKGLVDRSLGRRISVACWNQGRDCDV